MFDTELCKQSVGCAAGEDGLHVETRMGSKRTDGERIDSSQGCFSWLPVTESIFIACLSRRVTEGHHKLFHLGNTEQNLQTDDQICVFLSWA